MLYTDEQFKTKDLSTFFNHIFQIFNKHNEIYKGISNAINDPKSYDQKIVNALQYIKDKHRESFKLANELGD